MNKNSEAQGWLSKGISVLTFPILIFFGCVVFQGKILSLSELTNLFGGVFSVIVTLAVTLMIHIFKRRNSLGIIISLTSILGLLLVVLTYVIMTLIVYFTEIDISSLYVYSISIAFTVILSLILFFLFSSRNTIE